MQGNLCSLSLKVALFGNLSIVMRTRGGGGEGGGESWREALPWALFVAIQALSAL